MGAVLLQDSRSAPRALRPATSLAGATVPVSGLGSGVHDNQPTWPQQPRAMSAGGKQRAHSPLDRRKIQSATATRSIGALLMWPKYGAWNVRSGAAVRVMR